MKRLPALTLALLVLAPLHANAQSGGFAAIDAVFSHIDPKNVAGSADVNAVQFRFGAALNNAATLAGEFRAGLGFGRDTSGGVRYEVDRHFGAYFRGQFPNRMPLRPYGLIGVTRVETTQGGRGDNYNDMSLGLGADYTINKDVFVSVEYLRAVDRSEAEVSNFTIGVGARF
ncbi:outer membrane beta-barrel protein [Alcanivorax sp. 1008]|uniref:outer membrane beta-barrel protein n=1 Tax=Alcanivorax sp. 1008 TaxID=2816853 RepID=UPI001D51689B|nr:outer membrane beta-barrel protein [Alcanivorax sp. 1008]MCC1497030.1 outer membrane beta-barrel protein [Alcanivorax sp. 1008]